MSNKKISALKGASYIDYEKDYVLIARDSINNKLRVGAIIEEARAGMPEKLSQLINDIKYLTEDELNTKDYATKSFVRAEVLNAKPEVDLNDYATVEYVDEQIKNIELTPGPEGPQGIQGEVGPQGPQGIPGEPGQKGDTGADGKSFTYDMFTAEQLEALKGPKGDTGETGPAGKDGTQGPKGDTGATGKQGPKGDQGEPGKDGSDYILTEDDKQEIASMVITNDSYYNKTEIDNKINNIKTTTAISVNGQTYNQNNGTILIPDYPDITELINLVVQLQERVSVLEGNYIPGGGIPEDKSCTSITLSPTSYTFTTIGQQVTLTPTVTPNDTTDTITWQSSSSTIAKVNTNGVVTALTTGSCTITATCGSKTATCAVQVNTQTTPTTYTVTKNLSNVSCSNSASSVTEGSSYYAKLTCSDDYEITSVKVLMNGVIITSQVYTTENSEGIINIPNVSGNIQITATATEEVPGGGATEIPEGGCTKLTIYPTKYTFDEIDGWEIPTVTKTPSDTTDVVTWKSSNTSVATVTSAGVIQPVGNGTCVITATCGTQTATCTVTVNDANAGVTLTDFSLDVDLNNITTQDDIIASIVPTPSSLQGYGSGKWISDNSAVLGVHHFEGVENMKLYPGKNGTANLTVTYDLGEKGKIEKVFTATVKLTDNTPNTTILYNNPTITIEGVRAKAVSGNKVQYFDTSYMENDGHPSYNSSLALKDSNNKTYYLALTNKGSSPFGKDGLHLDSGAWYTKAGSDGVAYPMQHSVIYFNDFDLNLTVRNVNNSVPSALMNKILEIYNQSFVGLNMTLDNSSANTVELVEIDDVWYGVNTMYERTKNFVNQLNATKIIENYGEYSTTNMAWLGISVHEFAHTLGLKDRAAFEPTIMSYERDREKCFWIQPNDIKWIERLHKNTYGVDLTTSQEEYEAQVASLDLEALAQISYGDQYNFDYAEFDEKDADLIVECNLEYVDTQVINISRNSSVCNMEYRVYNIVNENIIEGALTNNQVKIHVSQLCDLDTTNRYRLYLKTYENVPCSIIHPDQGIIKL